MNYNLFLNNVQIGCYTDEAAFLQAYEALKATEQIASEDRPDERTIKLQTSGRWTK